MTIGVLLNAQKAVNMEDVQRMASICKDGGARLLSDAQNASFWGMQRVARDELYQSCEIIIVFGGDGTLLAAARGAARHGNAVLGINLGRLGFLDRSGGQRFMRRCRRGHFRRLYHRKADDAVRRHARRQKGNSFE